LTVLRSALGIGGYPSLSLRRRPGGFLDLMDDGQQHVQRILRAGNPTVAVWSVAARGSRCEIARTPGRNVFICRTRVSPAASAMAYSAIPAVAVSTAVVDG
jgi:hypothetical protein